MIIAHDASNPAGFSSSSDLAIFGSHQSTGTLFEVFNSADTSVLKILGSGNLSIHGTITASGYNDSNWNTAYTHSQQAHAPSNAEQNVKSDWSAGSGDAEILNKPNVQYTSAIPEITATVGGLMSNANAVKFAGIATGATNVTDNNQIANSAGYITDGNTNWNNSYGFITASSTETLTNKTWILFQMDLMELK